MNTDNANNKSWHVIYTRSRAEKKVSTTLSTKGIEHFLPQQKQLRQWKDRKKWVETPLLPGYCFVYINRNEYDKVLQDPNVVCYLTFEGKPAIVPDIQIENLKQMLKQKDFSIEVSHENFETGKQVEIMRGPLVGLTGQLVETRGKDKFILRIDQINATFTIEIPSKDLSVSK